MERKGLGRGLAALIPSIESITAMPEINREQGAVDRDIAKIPIALIAENRLQPRRNFDAQKLRELADSIREHGMLVPLIVSQQDGKYELISGERRLRAARLLEMQEVPVVIRGVDDVARLELALIENIQREDLDPIEEANAYQQLIDQFSYTQEKVADRVGKERVTVANLLRLLKLPAKVREALQSGQISMGHARALLGVAELERQFYFVEKIIDEGWSVRELEARIAARRTIGLTGRIQNLKPLAPHLVQILDEIRRSLGTQVRVIPASQKKGRSTASQGKILIEYFSEEDLDRIYRIIVHRSGEKKVG